MSDQIRQINAALAASLLPRRAGISHKGEFGTLLAIVGSRRYRGAAVLAAMAATRCGVGLVKLAGVEEVNAAAAVRAPSCVFVTMEPNSFGAISMNMAQTLFDEAVGSSAVLMGCGLGGSNDIRILTGEMLHRCTKQLILDADSLNVLPSLSCETLKMAAMPPIITPHIGEMAKLSGAGIDAIKADPASAASAFAAAYSSIVVLKDYVTLIASPEGDIFKLDSPNSGLAHAGMGDVLSGIIASLCASGMNALDSAVLAVYLHSRAGALCAEQLTEFAMTSFDLPDRLPLVFSELNERPISPNPPA